MAAALCDRAIRVELGIPRTVAAKLAGVDRRTLAMFEAGPQFVRAEQRELCQRLYAQFRHLLAHAPGKRA